MQACGFNWFKSYQKAYLLLPDAIKTFSTLNSKSGDLNTRFYPSLTAFAVDNNGTSAVLAMYEKRKIAANMAVDVIIKNVASEITTCSSACLDAIDLIDTKLEHRFDARKSELVEMWNM